MGYVGTDDHEVLVVLGDHWTHESDKYTQALVHCFDVVTQLFRVYANSRQAKPY